MSNKISDLKLSLERHFGGESGEHQPARVIKPDSKFSRLLRFKSYRVFEGFLRASSSLGKPRQPPAGHQSEPQCPGDTNVLLGLFPGTPARGYFAPFQRATVTRKNLAGMEVASLLWF